MNSSSTTAPKTGSKIKLYLIGIVVLLILGAILYVVGLQAGKAQLAAQEAKFGIERNGLQSQLITAQTGLDAARDRASIMEARAALYRSAIDLDARNFGTANTHLKEAATALGNVKSAPEASALQSQISGTDLNVAVNLGQQRQQVLAFAEQLNALVPAETNSTLDTASMPEDVASSPSTP